MTFLRPVVRAKAGYFTHEHLIEVRPVRAPRNDPLDILRATEQLAFQRALYTHRESWLEWHGSLISRAMHGLPVEEAA